jgi:hypothetical protein
MNAIGSRRTSSRPESQPTCITRPGPLRPAVLSLNLGGSQPRAEKACSEALALHEAMSEADVDRAARTIAEFLF